MLLFKSKSLKLLFEHNIILKESLLIRLMLFNWLSATFNVLKYMLLSITIRGNLLFDAESSLIESLVLTIILVSSLLLQLTLLNKGLVLKSRLLI